MKYIFIRIMPPTRVISEPSHLEEYEREEVYCNRRNTVERVRLGDKDFVIKKYKRPALINCLIYTWFRKSKAQRAFEYAELFSATGNNRHAPPVAYIEIKIEWFSSIPDTLFPNTSPTRL